MKRPNMLLAMLSASIGLAALDTMAGPAIYRREPQYGVKRRGPAPSPRYRRRSITYHGHGQRETGRFALYEEGPMHNRMHVASRFFVRRNPDDTPATIGGRHIRLNLTGELIEVNAFGRIYRS